MNTLPLTADGRTSQEPRSAEEVAGYVVATAVWAPSVHNTQPWWFSADGQDLCLHADAHRHELTKSECFELLAGQQLGRVAVVDDRGPIALPVNFVLDRHMVVFRTDEGTKLDAARCGALASFEVDGTDAATHTSWSVVVRGEIAEVTDPAELARLRELPLYPSAPGAKSRYVRILPASLSGRRVRVPDGTHSS